MSGKDTPLSAALHHIAIGSPDPAALAAWHSSAMGLKLTETASGILGRGRGRRLIFTSGQLNTLAYAAFAVSNELQIRQLAARLEKSDWPIEPITEDPFFLPGGLSVRDPDGNEIRFGLGIEDNEPHEEGLVGRLQHVVVASRQSHRLSSFYQDVLGFTLSDNVIDDTGEIKTAFLRCSSEHHAFAVFQASSDRFDHHCYEAGDWSLIREWGDHFAALNVKVEWGPGRHGPGNNLFLFVHDLDGNWLEISAELEIVAEGRPVGTWPQAERTLNLWGTGLLRK